MVQWSPSFCIAGLSSEDAKALLQSRFMYLCSSVLGPGLSEAVRLRQGGASDQMRVGAFGPWQRVTPRRDRSFLRR